MPRSKSSASRLLAHLGLSPQGLSTSPIDKTHARSGSISPKPLPERWPRPGSLGADIYFIDEAAVCSDAHRGLRRGKIGEAPVVTIVANKPSASSSRRKATSSRPSCRSICRSLIQLCQE